MKSLSKIKRESLARRHKRVRVKINGTKERPRLSVFRSNQHIYAQLIDDQHGKTLMSVSDLSFKKNKNNKSTMAKQVGQLIAAKALESKISQVVFDRGGYQYHGRIKQLAEGAREGGLKF
ncbi:MAG: 50S ribosomal protein L18 [Patescibacteria group bacterium]|nr:50S ribosomal protein L18 [Patescibacteria group bacterium]MDD5121039.1 50S ribosomal protein L18 [Patescibacteria group bacterium]MDD5221600.1 50S ribosomal protein L18 [Patescibacteria group bacterium]MDD5396042.1 50S ribosomal protein L18 [Patescibacteria group bacterium]